MAVLSEEIILQGTPVAAGLAVGKLFLLCDVNAEVPQFAIEDKDVDNEVQRFRKAVQAASRDIRKILARLKKEKVQEGVGILEAHLELLRDPNLSVDIEKKIRVLKRNAESIFKSMIEQFQSRFLKIDDPYLRERGGDIFDIGQRILGHLMQQGKLDFDTLSEGSVVFVRELTPSIVAEAPLKKVSAFITTIGSATCHAAIVARAKGICFLSSILFDDLRNFAGEMVAVDSMSGELILNPSQDVVQDFKKRLRVMKKESNALNLMGGLAAETADGQRIKLSANIDVDSELDMLYDYGGEGIGLYRSEFAFLQCRELPTEEEQFVVYRQMIDKLGGLPIVIRTFDIGGDKALESPYLIKEGHPYLGFRAIRFLLKERDLFRTQIRAILRAAYQANVSILFPMVSSVSELREAMEVVDQAKKELRKEKLPFGKNVKIGCMIEVPSAAIIADLLAPECDFLSIGTNDLVQYSLAVDRADHSLSDYYTPAHPGVLRLIKMTVSAGQARQIPVSVCGEVAADPLYVPILLGLGVRELSVATRFLPLIKQTLRNFKMREAEILAEKAMRCSTAQEIELLLKKFLQKGSESGKSARKAF